MDVEEIWGSTCKVLLRAEVGPVKEYLPYLERNVRKGAEAKSAISGKAVLAMPGYPDGTQFISSDELSQYAKRIASNKLDINSIKDIDSLIRALGESFCYSGNIVLGNSSGVANSNSVLSSSFVYNSLFVFSSKNVAHSYSVRGCENIVGTFLAGNSKFVLKGIIGFGSARTLECSLVHSSTDCYYSVNLEDCSDCMFSFNLRAKRRCIGNRELPPDKFAALKKKLIAEMCDTLKAKGALPAVLDIVKAGGKDG